jgi:hypothetical protein
MTPPEQLAAVLLLAGLAALAAAGVLRATRPVVHRAVGRTALELADRTGLWEGTRLTPHPHTRRVEPLRVRVERVEGTELWDVTRWHGPTVSAATDLDDRQAEQLAGEWWVRR